MKNRKLLTAAAAAAVILGLTVCASGAALEYTGRNTGTVQQMTESPEVPAQVTVSAKSTITVTPDLAELHLGCFTEAKEAADAQKQNTEKVNKVLDALKEMGIPEKSIQTANFNLWPQYDYSDNKERIVSYRAEVSITVTDLAIGDVGKVSDACIQAGANTMNGLNYKYSKYIETYREALAQAVGVCREKAEVLAKAAGKELGEVQSLTEGYQNMNYYSAASNSMMVKAEAAAMDAREMELMPGEISIDASVTAVYGVK